MYFLGVDIGSSSIKTAVLRVSEAGLPDAIIGKANIDYPTYYPIDDSSEQSADDWNHAAAVAIKGAVASMSTEEKNKIVGISFNTYITHYRLSYACYLMENTEQTILQCAYNSGFTSLRNFNRCFKDHLKITPTQYLRNLKAR